MGFRYEKLVTDSGRYPKIEFRVVPKIIPEKWIDVKLIKDFIHFLPKFWLKLKKILAQLAFKTLFHDASKTRNPSFGYTQKKSNFKCVLFVVARLPQRLKSTFFEKKSHSTGSSFGAIPLEKISTNLDFSLWGKQQCIVPKLQFFLWFSSLWAH